MTKRYLVKRGSPHVLDWTEVLSKHPDMIEIDEAVAQKMIAGDVSAAETAQLRVAASALKAAANALEAAPETKPAAVNEVDAAIEALKAMDLDQVRTVAGQMGVEIPADATEEAARELLSKAFEQLRALAVVPGGEGLAVDAAKLVTGT